MLRVLLAAMVPCFAIGFTGLLVTSIGRLLLAVPQGITPSVALGLTIAIMVGCTIATFVVPRRGARQPRPIHH